MLTAAQAAELLQVDEAEVVALAEQGELPGRRIGDAWRFSRAALMAWLAVAGDGSSLGAGKAGSAAAAGPRLSGQMLDA